MAWREDETQLDDSIPLLKEVGALRTDVADAALEDSLPLLDDGLRDKIGDILDLVYDAVRTRQRLEELEEDGWHPDEIQEVLREEPGTHGLMLAPDMVPFPE